MSHKTPLVALGATTLIVLAACGGTTKQSDNSTGQTTQVTTPTATQKPHYPVTLKVCGVDQKFTQAPQRVVLMNGGSVAESSTILALGAEKSIIANAQSYGASEVKGRAEAIAALPKGNLTLNKMQDIPKEAMISAKPDFVSSVYAGGFDAKQGYATREELAKIGANTYIPKSACKTEPTATNAPQTIEDSYAMIRDYGKIFNKSERAEKLIAESKKNIAKVSSDTKGKPQKNIMIFFPGMGADDFSSIGGAGLWNDIFAKAGAKNVFDDGSGKMFMTVSKEKLATTKVDAVVVVNYMNPDPKATAQKVLDQFPMWQASKDKNIIVLSDSIYLGPSNHLAVDSIAKALH